MQGVYSAQSNLYTQQEWLGRQGKRLVQNKIQFKDPSVYGCEMLLTIVREAKM